jgi:hypothetical protein
MSGAIKTSPCGNCGKPSLLPAKLCADCWEVERRLDDYMGSRAGRVSVLKRMSVEDLAHAILDLNNLGFDKGEGLSTQTLAGCRLWDDLADSALLVGGRSRRAMV